MNVAEIDAEIARLWKETVEDVPKKKNPGPRLRAYRQTRNRKSEIAAVSKRRNRANR